MSYTVVEMDGKELKFEYDRTSIIKMEEMGYNAINPSSKIYTNFEILIYGGLLKNDPKLKWKDALPIFEFMKNEYGMMETIETLSSLVNDVFTLEGNGKKMTVVGKKA